MNNVLLQNELRILQKKHNELGKAYDRLIEQYRALDFDYQLMKDTFSTLAVHNLTELYEKRGIIERRGDCARN